MSKIALYMRLSVEEVTENPESESILNQRQLLFSFVSGTEDLKGYPTEEFVDDGFSGTNTQRPAFQRMMEEVKQGVIKTIIVKDLSRFMRDYITIGDYLENIFPFMGVRFIAITDGYDSHKTQGNGTEIDVQFKNLLSDFYTKDISEKVKTTRNARSKQGIYNTWEPPYGYMKNPEDKTKIIIDKMTFKTVQDVFEMYLDGLSTRKIARVLNERGDIVPSERKSQLTLMTYEKQMVKNDNKKKPIWMHGTIIKMLANETYTGTYCFNMTRRVAVGDNNTRVIPSEEWERVYDNHEAIVSYEVFNKCREIASKKAFPKSSKSTNYNTKSPLQQFVYCEHCGHKMAFNSSKRTLQDGTVKSFAYFRCRTCKMEQRPSVSYRVDVLEDEILKELKTRYKELPFQTGKKKKEVKVIEIDALIRKKDLAFRDYKSGRITKEDFKKIKLEVDAEIEESKSQIPQIQEKVENINTEKLTRELVKQFIDKIIVNTTKEYKILFRD